MPSTRSTSSTMPNDPPPGTTSTTSGPKTSTFGSILANVPKLRGAENFRDWEFALGIAMKHVGCYDATAGVTKKPTDSVDLVEWEARTANGLTAIGLTVESSQYVHIRDCSDGATAWAALQGVYAKRSRANRVALKKLLYNYKHDITLPIQSYISGILSLASSLQSIGVKLDDDDVVDVLVFNLADLWGSVADSLLARDELTIEDAKGILQGAEGRRGGASASVDSPNSAYMAQANGSRGGRRNGDSGGVQSSKPVCWRCDREGHKVADCPDRPGRKQRVEHAGFASPAIQGEAGNSGFVSEFSY
jgi:hypothetical protein